MNETTVLKRRRMPAGVLGMLAVVGLVELFIAGRPIHFSNLTGLDRLFGVRAARKQAPDHEILFLGDSMVKMGIVPQVVSERAGRSALNLASLGGPAPATYFVFRHALEAGTNPDMVIVDFGPRLLAAEPRRDIRNASEALGPVEILDLAWTVRSPNFLASLAVRAGLPSFRSRDEVRSVAQAYLRGAPCRHVETNRASLRNWRVNDGAMLMSARSVDRSSSSSSADPPASARWRVHRVNRAYVERFFELAASRGIRTYWLLPPENPLFPNFRMGRAGDEAYLGFVREIQARYPNVTILDARRGGYDPSHFLDPVHLGIRGALVLSASTADALLAASEDSSRSSGWVDLSSPEAVPAGLEHEDFERSRLAVGASEPTGG